MKKAISAVVCTHNRARYLLQAIDSLALQTLNPEVYEIIVVDNGSTDDTRAIAIAKQLEYSHVRIRYILEPELGLSIARNRGAQEALGEYVAYIDDDATADPNWLETLLSTFQELSPSPSCVGGRVYLDWAGPIPKWFPDEYSSLYTFLDHGEAQLVLSHNGHSRSLHGANIAFCRELIVNQGYSFSIALGRKGASLISGEESHLISRLLESGFVVVYEPRAIVKHIVLPDRRTFRFLARRVIGDGATKPILEIMNGQLVAGTLFHRSLYDFKLFCTRLFQALYQYVKRNPERGNLALLAALNSYGRFTSELNIWLHSWNVLSK